ncbi:MAG: SDR family oxidoreductase [Planctomycetes bacterium]|nr:SDR family oxidoreductase [Planctomycetota bacterium]
MSGIRRDLRGKTALVTGAARRLGRHLALSLAEAGADVVVHHNEHGDEAEAVRDEIRALGREAWALRADFLEPGAAGRLADEVRQLTGGYQILVNNVGNYLVKGALETTVEQFRAILEANLLAPHELIRAFVAQLPEGEAGQILNVGYAGVEHIRPHPRATAYQISKTGLYILTKTFAEVLAPRGIRCNMISPGQLENSVDLPDDLGAAIPLGRAGRLADVEDALHYLLDFDGYVTGVNLDVAGGYRL